MTSSSAFVCGVARSYLHPARILPVILALSCLSTTTACRPAPVLQPVPQYQLPPPTQLPNESLLPEEGPKKIRKGEPAPQDGAFLTNAQAAALAGELSRLDGLDEAVRAAERDKAALVVDAANQSLLAERALLLDAQKRVSRYQKALPWVAASSFTIGVAGMAALLILTTP